MSKFLTAEQINNAVALCKDEPFSKASVFAITEMLPEAITHCKDCEYWDSKEKVCNHCWGGLENCSENEFCSRGERKETDDRQ